MNTSRFISFLLLIMALVTTVVMGFQRGFGMKEEESDGLVAAALNEPMEKLVRKILWERALRSHTKKTPMTEEDFHKTYSEKQEAFFVREANIVWTQVQAKFQEGKEYERLPDGSYVFKPLRLQIDQTIEANIKANRMKPYWHNPLEQPLLPVKRSETAKKSQAEKIAKETPEGAEKPLVSDYVVTGQGDICLARQPFTITLEQISPAAWEKGKQEIKASSCFRSNKQQAAECAIHKGSAENCLKQVKGANVVLPGHSLHNLGLAIDFLNEGVFAADLDSNGVHGCVAGSWFKGNTDKGHRGAGAPNNSKGFFSGISCR